MILYTQETLPNAPVLLEEAVFGHLMLRFVDVDALNDTVSSPNLVCGLYTILYNKQK